MSNVVSQTSAEQEAEGSTINVYYRKDDKSLGQFKLEGVDSHKDAILAAKEALVAEGSCLTNIAVLAVITGGIKE